MVSHFRKHPFLLNFVKLVFVAHKKAFDHLSVLFCFFLPSACEWKMSTETVVGGWKGLLMSSSSLAAEKEGKSVGSSFSVTLAGRAGSSASMGAMMQWDSRHSGLTLQSRRTKRTLTICTSTHCRITQDREPLPLRCGFHLKYFSDVREMSQVHTFGKHGKRCTRRLVISG